MKNNAFSLPDGRKLGYATYGTNTGWPVVYFHGTPSSRLEPMLLNAYDMDVEAQLEAAGLWLIAVDRPGMGLSSFHEGGTLLSTAKDVSCLLQSLGISGCSMLCWSGGGPFALAAAWQYPMLVKDVFMFCSFTRPFNRKALFEMTMNKWYFLSAKFIPRILQFAMNKVRHSSGESPMPQWLSGLSDADQNLLKNPRHSKAVSSFSLMEACRVDSIGAVHEARLYFNDFGFDVEGIQQPVHYWWGNEDRVVVRHHADVIENRVKNKVMHYKNGEGHLSIYIHCFTEVLQAISLGARSRGNSMN